MLSLGYYMTNTPYSDGLYTWHKSLGVILSATIGIRIYWSIRHPWQSSTSLGKIESWARKVTHRLLVFLLFAMPASGLTSSAFSGWSVHVFNFTIVPKNLNAEGEVEAFSVTIYEAAKLTHEVLGYLFSTLILLHVAAVLKHHFLNKDQTLLEMLKFKK